MQAALGISTLPDPEDAGREAGDRLAERLGVAPELVLLLATAAHGRGASRVLETVRERAGGAVVGGTVDGIVAPAVEVTDYPAVLALGLCGLELRTFFVPEVAGRETEAGERLAAGAGTDGEPEWICLLADSGAVDLAALGRGVASSAPGSTLLATGAGAPRRGRPLLWRAGERGREIESDAVAGFALRGRASGRVEVTQAGTPVTDLMPVTRARGNWVLGLGGRPALDVYEEAARRRGARLDAAAPPPLLAGLADPALEGVLDVRNVVGLDPERRAFSLPEPMSSGRALALVELDGSSARSEMRERFRTAAAAADPLFGLYLNCRARGAALFGEPGVEAMEIANAFPECPIAGASSPFQLASRAPGEAPRLLTYAGALGLLDGAQCDSG